LRFGHFILDNVPVLREESVLDADNICGNPVYRSTEAAESAVYDHEVSLGYDCARLVLQRTRKALDQIEESFPAGLDVGTVLNVIWRPEPLRCIIVALVI
jgi:hypothetical protein